MAQWPLEQKERTLNILGQTRTYTFFLGLAILCIFRYLFLVIYMIVCDFIFYYIMQEHESNYQLFLQWFHDQGGLSSKIKYPEYFQDIGIRGVVAIDNIQGNEVFLAVPKKLIIGIDNVKKSELRHIVGKYPCFQDSEENQGEFNVLTLFVIWEKMKGQSSFYFPYLQVIQHSQTIISWSDSDISKLSDPNITPQFVNQLRKQFHPVFQQFKLIILQYPSLFKQSLTWEIFMECYTLVMTRCFGWGLPEIMLVPYADFLNHNSHGIHHYTFNKKLEERNQEEYIMKRRELNLALLGIDNKDELPKSYIPNKRQQFIFKHKDTLSHSSPDLNGNFFSSVYNLHSTKTKQCLDLIHREMIQDSYDIELLASSNSEDNDSEQEEDENALQIRVRINKVISTEIEPAFEQPKPEVNRQFEDNVTFNWWYKAQQDQTYFIVAANRYIKQAQQIFNNYGRRSNKFLLIYYGFTYQNNKYDSVSFRFWNEQIYHKTGRLIFVKYLTQKDWIECLCLGNDRHQFQSASDEFRLKLDNICYQLMAFLRLRIIGRREPFKTMFFKKLINFYQIHSLELQALMLDDYITVLKAVSQIYEPQRNREQLSSKDRNFFANILIQSNKNIIENHIKGVNILRKVVNKMKEGKMSLLELYKSSLTLEEQKLMQQNGNVNILKTVKCNNRKFVLDYFKMMDRYLKRIGEK